MKIGEGTLLYKRALDEVLKTNEQLPKDSQAEHPEEKAQLEAVNKAINKAEAETRRIVNGPFN